MYLFAFEYLGLVKCRFRFKCKYKPRYRFVFNEFLWILIMTTLYILHCLFSMIIRKIIALLYELISRNYDENK